MKTTATKIKLSKKHLKMSFDYLINAEHEDIKIEFDENEAIQYIEENTSFSSPEKVLALCLQDGLTPNDLDSITENGNYYTSGVEYLIVTDEEGDELWDDYLESYIEECVLDQIPEAYRNYFDNEAFKSDCRMDGRAHSLSTYNGSEETQTVNGTDYYIYRTN